MACLTDRSPLLSSAEQGRRTERCSLPNCEDVRLTTTQYTSRRNKGTLLIPDTYHPNPVPLSHNPTPVPEKVPHQSRRRREDTLDSAQCSTEVCVCVVSLSSARSVRFSAAPPVRQPDLSEQILSDYSVRLFSQIQTTPSKLPQKPQLAPSHNLPLCTHCCPSCSASALYVRVTRHVCVLWGGRNSC